MIKLVDCLEYEKSDWRAMHNVYIDPVSIIVLCKIKMIDIGNIPKGSTLPNTEIRLSGHYKCYRTSEEVDSLLKRISEGKKNEQI